MRLSEAQRTLLGIIESVESGSITAQEAFEDFQRLKADAPKGFVVVYTVEDFQKIATESEQTYNASSGDFIDPEPSFEASDSY